MHTHSHITTDGNDDYSAVNKNHTVVKTRDRNKPNKVLGFRPQLYRLSLYSYLSPTIPYMPPGQKEIPNLINKTELSINKSGLRMAGSGEP